MNEHKKDDAKLIKNFLVISAFQAAVTQILLREKLLSTLAPGKRTSVRTAMGSFEEITDILDELIRLSLPDLIEGYEIDEYVVKNLEFWLESLGSGLKVLPERSALHYVATLLNQKIDEVIVDIESALKGI